MENVAPSGPVTEPTRSPPRGVQAAAIVLSVTAGALAQQAYRAWRERQGTATDATDAEHPSHVLADQLRQRARPVLLEAVDGFHAATDEVFERVERFVRDL